MAPRVSVTVSTHNPHPGRLARTLDGLLGQSLPVDRWELIVVDNASGEALRADTLGLAKHPGARLVREDRLGLVYGRLAGIAASRGDLIVFVDDDIVLAPDYLAHAVRIHSERPRLGVACGKSIPEFETEPPSWVREFYLCLALWDHGDRALFSTDQPDEPYPRFAGGGGGAVYKRAALDRFVGEFGTAGKVITGRSGASLASGEDNDIVLSLIEGGWVVGYFPELTMTHLIPAARLTPGYLARLNHGIARTWVQVLGRHGIRPWPKIPRWTAPLRKWRAYFRYRAWAGPAEYVRWRGACGQFEGQVALGRPGSGTT